MLYMRWRDARLFYRLNGAWRVKKQSEHDFDSPFSSNFCTNIYAIIYVINMYYVGLACRAMLLYISAPVLSCQTFLAMNLIARNILSHYGRCDVRVLFFSLCFLVFCLLTRIGNRTRSYCIPERNANKQHQQQPQRRR